MFTQFKLGTGFCKFNHGPRGRASAGPLGFSALLGGTLLAGVAQAQAPNVVHEWKGGAADVCFGHAIANVGDLDGNGSDEILIGARPNSGGPGAAFIYRGEDGSLFKTFVGGPSDLIGADVGRLGDLNGDGVDEIYLGSYAPSNTGRVDVLSYSRTTGVWTTMWSRLGSANGDLVYHAAPTGDFNGGGPDVFIGGYGVNNDSGAVHLVDGLTGQTIRSWYGTQANSSFGGEFVSVPDLDSDGKPDLLISANRFDPTPQTLDAGRLFLYSGDKTNVPIRIWDGAAGDNLGSPLSLGPDIDQDGYEDILVGSQMANPFPLNGGAGRASIYSLKTNALLKIWDGISSGERFGSISRVGDVNGDGMEDIAIGAPFYDGPAGADSGRLELYSGRELTRLLFTLSGTQAGEQFGASAPGGAIFAGDMNSDGYAELVVAATQYDGQGLPNSGRVVVLAGDVHMPGVTQYGASKQLCSETPIPLSVTSLPTPGNTEFAITAIHAPLGCVAIPVIGIQPADLHVGWLPILVNFASPFFVLPAVNPVAAGEFYLPATPPTGYVGPLAYLQLFFVEQVGSCAPIGNVVAASNALHL